MDIIVRRGVGGKAAPDIIDPLLATVSAGLERGRVEMDKNGTGGMRQELVAVFRPGVERGDIIEVLDYLQGVSWKGVVKGVTNNNNGGIPTTTLSVDRL